VTKIIPLTVVNLVTPKVGAKHELLFNKPASADQNVKQIPQSAMSLNLESFMIVICLLHSLRVVCVLHHRHVRMENLAVYETNNQDEH